MLAPGQEGGGSNRCHLHPTLRPRPDSRPSMSPRVPSVHLARTPRARCRHLQRSADHQAIGDGESKLLLSRRQGRKRTRLPRQRESRRRQRSMSACERIEWGVQWAQLQKNGFLDTPPCISDSPPDVPSVPGEGVSTQLQRSWAENKARPGEAD